MHTFEHKIVPIGGKGRTGKALAEGRIYDLVTRAVPAYIFILIVIGKFAELSQFLSNPTVNGKTITGLALYVSIASRLSVAVFIALNVLLFVIRVRPVIKAKGVWPRVTAVAGSLMISAVTLFPRVESSLFLTIVATALTLFGNCLSILAISTLGRSFSIMAEARRLVTTGFYSKVRHPLYTSEAIAAMGIVLQYFSVYTLLLFALQIALQVKRMKNEEAVLEQIFPEYREYKSTTARMIPGVY
jgi:protein-S-isoprenylcysteine O-methyltransferase Ste14